MIIARLNKRLIKGEGLPSPFFCWILIIVFINCCSAQFGTELWLHPNIHTVNYENNSSYIQVYNDSHIGLVKYDGSLNISNNRYGINYEKKIVNNKFRIYYDKYRSITKFIESREPSYSFNISNNYYELVLGHEYNGEIIATAISLSKNSKINQIFPSILLKIKIKPRIIISIGKYIQKVPFSLNIGYTDYLYSLSDIIMAHDINHIGLIYASEYYKIEFSSTLDNWEFNSSNAPLGEIDTKDGKIKDIYINSTFYIKDNKQVDIGYQNSNSRTEFNLIDSLGIDLININKYSIANHIFSFKYHYSNSKYNITSSFYLRGVDFILSDRVNLLQDYDYSALFNNSTFINNFNEGSLSQKMLSIILRPQTKSNYNPIFQVDWIQDQYDINIDTKGFALGIPLPKYIKNKYYNIIGKEAFNVRLGIKINLHHWMVNAAFSQHIPYKIDTKERVATSESGKKQKQEYYGGGKFNISVIRYLD